MAPQWGLHFPVTRASLHLPSGLALSYHSSVDHSGLPPGPARHHHSSVDRSGLQKSSWGLRWK